MPQLKAVIFDLDGILVDTSIFHGRAWADLVRSIGHEPPTDLEERVKGISRMASLKIALGDNVAKYTEEQLTELATRKNECYLEAVKGITPDDLFPGVKELFASLKSAGIKVVLGSASRNAGVVLEGLQILDEFDAISDGHTTKHGKPDPEVFVNGAAMVSAEPAECIVVEDATAGINAALDGGFVAVAMGTYESLSHAHLYVKDLSELNADRLMDLHDRFRSDRWSVVRHGINPTGEASLQTIFAVGNGNIGIRGYASELPLAGPAGIYTAGYFDKVVRPAEDPSKWSPFGRYWGYPEVAAKEQIEVQIVNCPNFLQADWRLDGEPIDFSLGTLKSLTRRLDMYGAVFVMEAHWVSPAGKEIRFTERRFASMDKLGEVRVQYTVEPLNFSGALELAAGIDTTVPTLDGPVPKQTIKPQQAAGAGPRGVAVQVAGVHEGKTAAFASSIRLLDREDAAYIVETAGEIPCVRTSTQIRQEQILYVERVATFATWRRAADPLAQVVDALRSAGEVSFGDARIGHGTRWRQLWENSDIIIEGSDADQAAIRFSLYHLLIAASPDDPGVSIAAKSLTGPGYRGMVFWDTDIHMLPFFVFTEPHLAKNLAMFRCLTLDGAREKAKAFDCEGACYPWTTGISGKEENERILKLYTHQHHITADVAYALQQYVDATGDMDFYRDHAAEVLIETGRYWLSKAELHGESFSIRNAGGPDEFHVDCDDSAYVLHMARYNLELADRAVRWLAEHAPDKLDDIRTRTSATEADFERFLEVASTLRTMAQPNGLLEQCEGFFRLSNDYDMKTENDGRPMDAQLVKQADVLMLPYLLPDRYSPEQVRVNWDYYEPRTKHASSLSHGLHGILAAELGMQEKSQDYCRRSLGMDLHDEMNNASIGAHMAANGLNWSIMTRGYGGTRMQEGRMIVEPRLPERWNRLCYRLKFRGADAVIDIRKDSVTVTNLPTAEAPLPLHIAGEDLVLQPDEEVTQATTFSFTAG